jgi:Arc/MetJ-type ribon-helix-helix transcriptional regulator
VKLSVSLSDEDVEFLDAYARTQGIASRSAVVQRAIRLLRSHELGPEYEAAFSEWEQTGDAALWNATAADGLGSDAAG